MNTNWIKPAALAVVIFLASLIVTIPARWLQQFMPENSPVILQGVSGTAWRGEAAQLQWQNQSLGQMQWKIKPLTLLTGKLGVTFNLMDNGLNSTGTAIIYRDHVVELKDTVIDGDITALPVNKSKLPVELKGTILADMKHVVIKEATVHAAEGVITWREAHIAAPVELPMGEVTLQITGKKGNLSGEFKNQNGAVDARGTMALTQSGQFTSDTRLKPNTKTPADIRELLPALGKPKRDGTVTLHYQGRMRF